MYKSTIATFVIFFLILIYSCREKSKTGDSLYTGLWKVEKVNVGEEVMTPNGRWMHFKTDSTQVSGNGWKQHSIGTWSVEGNNKLSIVNANGLDDPFDPFEVTFSGDTMKWSREEQGTKVEVVLMKTGELPKTMSDQLLGMWDLKSKKGNGPYFMNEDEGNESHLFFRWDGRFILWEGSRQIHGVYNTHGHKPEVELIPYGVLNRNFWRVEVSENTLLIQLLGDTAVIERTFNRGRNFPGN